MIVALVVAFAVAGYLWVGIFATGTEMAFLWPGIFAIAAAGLVAALAKRGGRPAAPAPICLGAALAFAAYIAWRALASDVAYFGRIDLLLALPVLVVYGLFATSAGGRRARLAFVVAMFVLLLGNVATALYQQFGDKLFSIVPGYSRDIISHHPSGFYNVHPHLAGFLEAVIPFAVALFLLGRMGPVARIACALVALTGCAGLVVAMSRGGFLGALAALAVVAACFVYLSSRLHADLFGRFRWLLFGAIALALAAFVVLGGLTVNKRFGGALVDDKGKMNSSGRTAYWQAAWQQFEDAPITGAGARSFSYHFNKHFPDGFWVGTLTPERVHNDYLQTLAEYGLIGGVLAVIFIVVHLRRGVGFVRWSRNVRFPRDGERTSNELALTVGALGAAAAYVVHSFFDFNMHLLANASLMGFAFAVLAAPGTRADRPASATLFARVAIPAVSVILIAMGLRFAAADNDLRVGERAYREGDEATATGLMHRVVEADPQNFRAIKNLALFRFKKTHDSDLPDPVVVGYVKQALEGFEESLLLHPYDYFSLVYAGRCESYLAVFETEPAARARRFETAAGWLAKANTWAPKRFEPATWQGDLLRTQAYEAQFGGDLPRAIELAKLSFERFSYAMTRTPARLRGKNEQQFGVMEMKRLIPKLERELSLKSR